MTATRSTPTVRCAIYTRSATDNSASLADQEQICRAAIASHSPTWEIGDDSVFTDRASSGLSWIERPGLASLLAKAGECPRPFDLVLIDSPDRLGRNCAIVLEIVDLLASRGVDLYFVYPGLGSMDANFRTLFSLVNDMYVCDCSKEVRRGQHEAVRQGRPPGGRCYRYASYPVKAASPRNGVAVGVMSNIVELEAETVRRIYGLFADGMPISRIAGQLKEEKVSGPGRHGAGKTVSSLWSPQSIRRILGGCSTEGSSAGDGPFAIGILKTARSKDAGTPTTQSSRSNRRTSGSWTTNSPPRWTHGGKIRR